jgi:hypothetical protein
VQQPVPEICRGQVAGWWCPLVHGGHILAPPFSQLRRSHKIRSNPRAIRLRAGQAGRLLALPLLHAPLVAPARCGVVVDGERCRRRPASLYLCAGGAPPLRSSPLRYADHRDLHEQGGGEEDKEAASAMERGASPRRSPAKEGAAATRAPPHPRPLRDIWRLRKKVTRGAHMSASGEGNHTMYVDTNTV